MDAGQKVSGRFVVTGRYCAELFEFCEEVFDQVACFVEVTVKGPGDFSIGFGRDDDGLVFGGQQGDDPLIGIECLVGDQQIERHGG